LELIAMPPDYFDVLILAGRFLLGSMFVIFGMRHFFFVPVPLVVEAIQARSVPFPRLVFYSGTVFEMVCGLLLMSGTFVVPAALGLVVFVVAASAMLLNFWDMTGEKRESTINALLNNIGIIGGLLLSAAYGIAMR
jgi:putative oxidoreductase